MKIIVIQCLLMFSWALTSCKAQAPTQNQESSRSTAKQPQVIRWLDQLQAKDEKARSEAAKSLLQQGTNAWNEVAKAVWGDFMDAKSARALDAFVQQGSDAVPLMLHLIGRETTGLLRHNPGVSGLFKMGTNAIPGLEKTLRDTNPAVRFSAIDPLRILGDSGSAHVLVRTATTETDDEVRLYAIDALGYFGLPRKAPDFVCRALRELLNEKLEKARITAAYSLAKACRTSALDALPLLVKGVSSTDRKLAKESAFALNYIGTNAVSALAELGQAVGNADDRTADDLFRLFAKIGDPAFLLLQKGATNSVRNGQRMSALNSLGDFSTSTRTNLSQTVAILSEALKDRDRDIRHTAVNSLRRAAVERKETAVRAHIAEKLRPLLNDKDEWIRNDVESALEQIGSAGASKQ